jgi:hypothetical protein
VQVLTHEPKTRVAEYDTLQELILLELAQLRSVLRPKLEEGAHELLVCTSKIEHAPSLHDGDRSSHGEKDVLLSVLVVAKELATAQRQVQVKVSDPK